MPTRQPRARDRAAGRPLRSCARPAAGVADARPGRACRGGQKRHGQDDALQRDHGPGARDGQYPLSGPGVDRPAGEPDHAARHRLRAAGAPGLAFADRGRASPAGGAIEQGPVDRRARLPDVSAPRGAQVQRRRRALRGRAADARDRARTAAQPAVAGDGRAHRGPRAGDRAAGRGDAEVARGRRRDRGAADRAESGCGHRGGRYGERDGERAHRALDAGNGTRGGSRAAAAPAWRQDRG